MQILACDHSSSKLVRKAFAIRFIAGKEVPSSSVIVVFIRPKNGRYGPSFCDARKLAEN